MNRLDEIVANKRSEIERLRPEADALRRRASERNEFRGFRSALKRNGDQVAVIAEIKKASPSAGVIAESFDPIAVARKYETGGANAISVLTDGKFFQGSLDHLVEVRNATTLPILRKDFIIDEIQLAETVAHGADATLLIVAALAQKELVDLIRVGGEYGIDLLVEVHTTEELKRALDAGAEIVGINNRDLATFTVDLNVTEKIAAGVPGHATVVSESGIRSVTDVARLRACRIDAVLVGEALMRGGLTIDAIRGS